MDWMKKFSQKHIYIFSFTVVFLAILLLYIFSDSLLSKSDNRLNYSLNGILAYLIPLIFVLIVCLLSGNISKILFRIENIGTGLLLGWLFLTVGLYNFVSSYFSFDNSSILFPSVQKIIFFTLIMLLVGIFEEFLYRGIILNSMINRFGYNKTSIVKSIILSSLIFGLGHLANLTMFPTLVIATISQIIYASLNGILFASIYLRCKNIWAVIILHAVYDWLVKASEIYHSGTIPSVPVDISVLSGIIEVIFAIPFALVGFFLLRKVFAEDISKPVIGTKSM